MIMTADNRVLQKTAGYLEKRGKLKFMNSWKKYWFVLEGQLLLFYGSKDDYDSLSPCRGSISLGPTSTVKPYSAVPIGFQITTRSTTITLRAETVSEQTKWMQAFLSALNQNQNTNKSPTKLSHFRYSSESVNKLADKKEEFSSTPTSSPQGRSPEHTPKARESPLIDRLQKLGARSYGSNFSVQSQILEGVKNSRQKSFVKESVAEFNRRDVNGAELNVQLSPARKKSNLLGNMTQDSQRDSVHKVDEVVLDDEDFCVCTLGKEAKEDEELQTVEEESVDIQSDKSFPITPNMLKQHLHTEINHNTPDSKPPPIPKRFSETEKTDPKIEDNEQSQTREDFYDLQNNICTVPKEELLINTEKKNCNEERELLSHQQRKNPRHYENVEIVPEFYLHTNPNEKVSTKNIDSTKSTIAKPLRERKLKNIQNLFLDSADESHMKHNADRKKEQNKKDFNTSTMNEPSTPTYSVPDKERKLKNNINLHTEPKHPTPPNGGKETYPEESSEVMNNPKFLVKHFRDKSNKTQPIRMKTDADLHLYAEPEDVQPVENNREILASMYAETNREQESRNMLNPHLKIKNKTPTNSERRNYSGSREEMNSPLEHSSAKSHDIKPIQTKTHVKLRMQADSKIESSVKHNNETPVPTNTERKKKNIINSHTDPKDETSTNCYMNYDNLKFSLSAENKDDISIKNKSMIPAPIYTEPNKQRKLKNILNSLERPEDDTQSGRGRRNAEPNNALNTPHIAHIGEKPHNKEPTKLDTKFHSHDKPRERKTSQNNFKKLAENTYEEVNDERQFENTENIYTEPEDELFKGYVEDEQTWKDPSNVELKKTKTDLKLHPLVKPKPESFLKHYDNSGHLYTEVVKEITPRNFQNDQSTYEMIDNDLYAAPNTELMKFVNPRNDTTSPEHEQGCENKDEQRWIGASNNQRVKTKTVKPKPETSIKRYDNSGHVYTEVIKEIKPNTELMKSMNLRNETTSKTEELQCEMELGEEAIDEFECDNDLYGSPDKLFDTPRELCTTNKGLNETSSKNWRKFQFPPPPKDDDDEIYAEPFSHVTENDSEFKDSENQDAELELENDLYGETITENNNYQYFEKYPEYEEAEIICDNDIYNNLQFTKTGSLEKPEEVEYSVIPDVDEKTTDHYYSQPFNTQNEDTNLYEDPEELHIEKKKEKIEPVKPKKKNRRQHSEPFSKNFKIEETKKSDSFIQKLFKQSVKKNCDKIDKFDGFLPDDDADDTLVVLTEIQQLLEKKKKIIKAMAVQCRNLGASRSLSKSESADLDKIGRAKSYPSRFPDLLKGLNKYPAYNTGFPALDEEYSTVRDVIKKEGEDIYSEVLSDPRNDDRKARPTRSAKFDALVYRQSSSND